MSCRSLENECHRGSIGGGKGVIRKERLEVGDWKESKDIEKKTVRQSIFVFNPFRRKINIPAGSGGHPAIAGGVACQHIFPETSRRISHEDG